MKRCCKNCYYCLDNMYCMAVSLSESNNLRNRCIPANRVDSFHCKDHIFADSEGLQNMNSLLE
jgi:hypothetical protein